MEKVYYKVHNKLEYLRVLQLVPSYIKHRWYDADYGWLMGTHDDVYIGWEDSMEYSHNKWPFANECYQLKPLYDFKEYLNQIEEC